MSDKDGGPAFPVQDTLRRGLGMTLRDYFAVHCPDRYLRTELWSMRELADFVGVTEYNYRKHYAAVISKLQYEYAATMLKEREK